MYVGVTLPNHRQGCAICTNAHVQVNWGVHAVQCAGHHHRMLPCIGICISLVPHQANQRETKMAPKITNYKAKPTWLTGDYLFCQQTNEIVHRLNFACRIGSTVYGLRYGCRPIVHYMEVAVSALMSAGSA